MFQDTNKSASGSPSTTYVPLDYELLKDDKMFNIVKKVIDEWDPGDLLKWGCPEDEWDSESRDIAKTINTDNTVDEISNILINNFSNVTMEDCLPIAQKIFDAIREV